MKITLNAEKRNSSTKTKVLRKKGWVPGCIYGKDTSINIQIKKTDLSRCLNTGSLKLEIDLGKEGLHLVSFSEIQKEVILRDPVHVSFKILNKNEKTTLLVPLEIIGEAEGKKEGGEVFQLIHELEIKGFPKDLPNKITIDVSSLQIGKNIKISDILKNHPFEVLTQEDQNLVTCHHIKEQDVEISTEENKLEEHSEETQGESSATSKNEDSKAKENIKDDKVAA